MNWEVWGPPLVVLGGALVVGAVIAVRAIQQGRALRAAPAENLAARKEQLLEALHEVDADRAKIGEEAWRARREALVDQAADTLRALDQGEAEAPADAAPAAAEGGRSWRVAAWATAVVAFFGALAWVLASNTSQRAEGQPMTGGSPRPDPLVVNAERALEANPNDLDALNTLTWAAIRGRDLQGAMSYLERARAQAPEDPYVLTHLAVLQLQIGMNDRAEFALQRALELQPGQPRALLFLALSRLQKGDQEGGVAALEQVLSGQASTEERQMANALLTQAKAPPPQTRVTGTVSVAEGQTLPEQGLLFIIARRSAEGGGPPVAALRLPLTSLPYSFTMTDKDMMLGGAWPENVWVQARVDADGNPSTKGEGDVESAVVGPIASGATEVGLVLGP